MFRPRVKYEHLPVRLGDDRVQIGGWIHGVGSVIPDPDGWVWELLTLLDGSRTLNQVAADLGRRFPSRPVRDVAGAIADLAGAGYLEDAAAVEPSELSARQRERYSRGQALWRWMDLTPRATQWHAQLALRQARITVVGVGGVGCTAALVLAVSGVGALHLVEPDVVELSNLNRQVLYTEDDVGRPKADAAAERLRSHNREVTVTSERLTVDGPGVLARLAVGCDVLLMAADRPADIWSWTNRVCLDTSTAWVHGGYHGPRVNVGIFQPGVGPCYECARSAAAELLAAEPPTTPLPRPAARASHAATAVSAGMAGVLAAHAVMRLVTGAPGFPVNRDYGINLVTLEDTFSLGVAEARADCPACGVRPT
ncbi:ThiF family adenylyltransferase [Actinokineospora sp. UTMC 2448]|uniref:ThiF family adenylyltransferase n=1 Tax=Actinokineospora sp. UTMC 2448 TaxID=2268449 RepID=UPI002164ACF8|nr:ThiF family adenylyltransferase [Actinokineospora sp. UTMC 2448]UVS78440.1 Molybdopterin-synthase adenylyltransferase [Actinokineospora sp. UTMC 2448]